MQFLSRKRDKSSSREFSSIRIPGSKKERPPLSHMSKHYSSGDWSTSSEFEELSSKITSEKEILALFEKMMEDMNLNEEKKAPLREKDLSTKREMVLQYIITAAKTGSLRSSSQVSPQEFLSELKGGATDERLFACLDSLRVSLTSNPVRYSLKIYIYIFFDCLEHYILYMMLVIQEKVDKKSQHKVIQCLKAFMNNKYGLERILGEEKSLALLAQAIDPGQPVMMTDVVKLLSAICIVGEENTLEKVLEAITTATEGRGVARFNPIVQGLSVRSVQLQVACMQLINALVTSPDELDFRLHIRNEFMRCGLREILPTLNTVKNDALDIQLKVFEEHKEEDMIEFSHRLEDIRSELEYPSDAEMHAVSFDILSTLKRSSENSPSPVSDVFNVLYCSVKDTSAEGNFLSILQHLLLVRNDYFTRPQYFKIIEECVSQIVLHRSGTDPDFAYRKRLDVDFSHLLEVCVDKARAEEFEQRASELAQKFDEEFLGRQDAQAQLLKREGKISELEAELQAYRNQVPISVSPSGVLGPPPPPPPPPPPGCASMPGMPPPPPPPLGLGGLTSFTIQHVLPFGLKPKKEFKPEASMKRLNWSKISPQEMSKSCFWVVAKEERYENEDLLTRLAITFGTQREELEKKSIKKRVKELKVLDPKIAQNLSIFLGSFRMPYEEIRRMILEVDEDQLTEPMIQNLVKYLPEQEQLNALVKYKSEFTLSLSLSLSLSLLNSECSVKRLRPRLNSILFKLQFEEQVSNLRPEIMAVNAACDEVKKSKAFSRLLELILLMGNFMNAGSRNAQSFGFNLSSLCKLKDTKSADQKSTLLHFLAETCEEKYPEVMKFVEDLQHVDQAGRVSAENLEKSLRQMEKHLLQLEKDLDTFSSTDDQQDLFFSKMAISFHTFARDQYQKLVIMHSNMVSLYLNMLEYFAIDPKKTSVEELFTDLSNFRAMFMQAVKENARKREAEEKQRKAKIAKEKAEREKQDRQMEKKRLLEVNTENDETGVMDCLLEALQSGAAFRDRRKRAPRPRDEPTQVLNPSPQRPVLKNCNHENMKAHLQRSRSRQNINFSSTRAPTAKEPHYESEPHPSAAHRPTQRPEREKEKEQTPTLCSSNGDTDVEALLARLRSL
uniref:Diaphanous-related formin 3 n=1 Tax=Cyprinus carpio TaxID=7962 RepID=A0A8C1PF99_CYPCA